MAIPSNSLEPPFRENDTGVSGQLASLQTRLRRVCPKGPWHSHSHFGLHDSLTSYKLKRL